MRVCFHSIPRTRVVLLWSSVILLLPQSAAAEKCLFISSYHQGYEWSDGVERGLRSTLGNHCEIKQLDMDTKRNKGAEAILQATQVAKRLIETWQPDVVITADDNAAKYVIQDHFKDVETPFVFCGVNWTVKEYGFPYKNVTGMIEVAPIRPMLKKAQEILPGAKKAFYIGANTLTEEKNLERFRKEMDKLGLQLDSKLVDSTKQWLAAYQQAQEADFLVIGSNSGINDWDEQAVASAIARMPGKLSVTNHEWMMPYSMLGFTKVPEEQGEWAAQAALDILAGTKPTEIAIVPNSRWDIWTNPDLISNKVVFPERLLRKSKKLNG